MDNPAYNFLDNLQNNKTLIDILVAMESFFDDMHLYAFENWFDGIVVDGPNLTRHTCSIILKFPENHFPDPLGAKRLNKRGAIVKYIETTEENPVDIKSEEDVDPQGNPRYKTSKVMFVEVTIPRDFIEDAIGTNIEQYKSIVDIEDYKDAETMEDDVANKKNNQEESKEDEAGDL